jgi:hypothetical protein
VYFRRQKRTTRQGSPVAAKPTQACGSSSGVAAQSVISASSAPQPAVAAMIALAVAHDRDAGRRPFVSSHTFTVLFCTPVRA